MINAGNPAQGRQTRKRRVKTRNRIYERFNSILTDLVSNWRELAAVSLVGIDFYIMVRTMAFIAGIFKGWW